MLDRLYYWLKRRGTNMPKVTKQTKEVEIPVGGITDDGTIYEKVVRPDGNDPIYKEVHIDTNQKATKQAESPTKTNTTDTTNK